MSTTTNATLALWHHIYGEQEHWLCIFSGQRAAPGEQRLDDPRQVWHRWPDGADQAEHTLMRLSGMGREVYTCAHLLTEQTRSAATAAPVWALYADIDGGVVPAELPQPTALVESSPERHQGYWRLTRALPPAQAEALNQRLTRAIGADPSGYDLTQVLRPPGTTSYKRATPFVVRLLRLDADRAVDPDELDRLLPQLPPPSPPRPPRAAARPSQTGDSAARLAYALGRDAKLRRLFDGDIADYPSHSQADIAFANKAIFWSDHDRVLVDSWYRQSRLSREKWDEVHYADGSTYGAKTIERADAFVKDGYRPPLGFSANGHAPQSNGQGINEEAAAPVANDSTERPTLDAQDEHLARITNQAWLALAAGNDPPYLFRYAGAPSRLERDAEGYPAVVTLNEDRLVHESAATATWFKQKRPKPDAPPVTVHALPPVRVIRNMLATPFTDQPLPILTAIVEVPTFAPDGSLHRTPGYHANGRTYYAPPDGFTVGDVPVRPTPDDIARARAFICDELLHDFPFVGEGERAHAVGLLLLPFARALIDGPTPLHLIEKPQVGTGATLLADMLMLPAVGRPITAMTEGRDEDEWRKRLTARLRSSPPAILIDNLREQLDAAALASVLTAREWEDRLLGTSDTIRIPVRCAWIATGNNPALSSEIARRTIRIRLDSLTDRPWLRRDFRHPDLREWATQQRAEIIWSALTLVAAWLAEGRPARPDAPRLGMYEHWSRVIGGILDLAEIPGFLANLEELYQYADTESDGIRALLEAWWDDHATVPVGTADLWSIVESGRVDLDLGNGNDRARKTKFGQLIAKLRDRHYAIEAGMVQVVHGGTKQRVARWRLQSSPRREA